MRSGILGDELVSLWPGQSSPTVRTFSVWESRMHERVTLPTDSVQGLMLSYVASALATLATLGPSDASCADRRRRATDA